MPQQTQNRYLTRKSAGVIINQADWPEYRRTDLNAGPLWKLDIGVECNRLLDLADGFEQGKFCVTGPSAVHNEHATILRSIVQRVAEFEELEAE